MKMGLFLSYVFMSFFGKVVSILGLTYVTYKGFDLIVVQFKTYIFQSLGGIPSDALNLIYLFGFGTVLNYFFGAFAFLMSMKVYSGLRSILNK